MEILSFAVSHCDKVEGNTIVRQGDHCSSMFKAKRGAGEYGILQKMLKGKVIAQYESGHCSGVRGRGHAGWSQPGGGYESIGPAEGTFPLLLRFMMESNVQMKWAQDQGFL